MLDREYELLGVSPDVSDEQLDAAYYDLKERLEEDRFLDGEAGNAAAEKLTAVKIAYSEIKNYRKEHANVDSDGLYKQVDEAIRNGDLTRAQELLDSFNERPAEWHYLQSVVYYKKNWMNESKKQLEIAKDMDPSNDKYKKAYDRMMEKVNTESDNRKNGTYSSGNGGVNNGGAYMNDNTQQMGGDSCLDFCCRLAICNLCLNCFCNCR